MTGWNLPPGCTARDIDEAAGGYDEPPRPTEAEQLAEELHEAESTIRRALYFLDSDMPATARAELRDYLKRRKQVV